MQERKLPRRTVLLLGAALAGWCAGCSVLPAEETASSDGFSTAKAEPVEKTGTPASICGITTRCTPSTTTAAW